MSSTSDQTDGTPTGSYYVVPFRMPVSHKVCWYYQEVKLDNGETRWDHVDHSPAVLYPGSGSSVVITLAPKSFVEKHRYLKHFWDSKARLVAAFAKPLGKPTDSPQTYHSAVSNTTPDTDWSVSIDAVTSEKLGVMVIFGIVEEVEVDGKKTLVVKTLECSVDPEIQN